MDENKMCFHLLIVFGIINLFINTVHSGICQGDPSTIINMCEGSTLKRHIINIDTSLFSLDTPEERCTCSISVNSSSLSINTLLSPNSLECGSAVTFKLGQNPRIECSESKEHIDTSFERNGIVQISTTSSTVTDAGYCIQIAAENAGDQISMSCEDNALIQTSEVPPKSVMEKILRQTNQTSEAVIEEIQRSPNASLLFEPLLSSADFAEIFETNTNSKQSTFAPEVMMFNNNNKTTIKDSETLNMTTEEPLMTDNKTDIGILDRTASQSNTLTAAEQFVASSIRPSIVVDERSSLSLVVTETINSLSDGDQSQNQMTSSVDGWAFLVEDISTPSSDILPSQSSSELAMTTLQQFVNAQTEPLKISGNIFSSTQTIEPLPFSSSSVTSDASFSKSTEYLTEEQTSTTSILQSISADLAYMSIVPSTIAIVPTKTSIVLASESELSPIDISDTVTETMSTSFLFIGSVNDAESTYPSAHQTTSDLVSTATKLGDSHVSSTPASTKVIVFANETTSALKVIPTVTSDISSLYKETTSESMSTLEPDTTTNIDKIPINEHSITTTSDAINEFISATENASFVMIQNNIESTTKQNIKDPTTTNIATTAETTVQSVDETTTQYVDETTTPNIDETTHNNLFKSRTKQGVPEMATDQNFQETTERVNILPDIQEQPSKQLFETTQKETTKQPGITEVLTAEKTTKLPTTLQTRKQTVPEQPIIPRIQTKPSMAIIPIVPKERGHNIGIMPPINKNALDKMFIGSSDVFDSTSKTTTVRPVVRQNLEPTEGAKEDVLSDETVTIIVIGSVVGILALIACIVIVTTCLQKRRKSSNMTAANDVEMNGKGIDNPLMDLGSETAPIPNGNDTIHEEPEKENEATSTSGLESDEKQNGNVNSTDSQSDNAKL